MPVLILISGSQRCLPLCADTGKMGIYETFEHRTWKKDCRCDCKICGRKPCRCDRVRVSGDAGEDIGKEKMIEML